MTQSWRTVRVFIDSTFRDMQAERDYLVRNVFPALRERLEAHRIHLVDIDLRWGVTKEQADNDEVLDVVFQAIDECRPFFLAMLGERYGWVPAQFPTRTLIRYPWVQHYPGKSVTELTIIYAALLNPEWKLRSLFYFRDPGVLDGIPSSIRHEFVETNPTAASKLADLKQCIRASGHPVMENYPARWDAKAYDPANQRRGRLVGLEEFGECVREQLWSAIRDELQLSDQQITQAPPDPLAEEQEYHESFMEGRLRLFIGRERELAALRDFVVCDEAAPYLLVLGEAGAGKSALLAKTVVDHCQEHPESLVIPHFVGASPRSDSVRLMLSRFCETLRQRFAFEAEIPKDVASLVPRFRELLQRVPASTRVLLVIDALDQLMGTDSARSANWLPRTLPPNVKVIVSCREGSFRQEFLQTGTDRVLHLGRISTAEAQAAAGEYLGMHVKSLDAIQMTMLLDNPAAGNPLFLHIMMEELRGFGSYERLQERIAAFPRDIVAGFDQVLQRLELETDPQLVRNVLSYLANTRRGLKERELVELCEPIAREDGLALLRELRPYLQRQGELINVFHHSFMEAIRKRYFASPEQRQSIQLRLCEYFQLLPTTDQRRMEEVPWLLWQAGDLEQAIRVLCDIDFIEARCQQGAIAELLADFEAVLREEGPGPGRDLVLIFLTLLADHASLLRDEELLLDEPDLLPVLAFNSSDGGPVVGQAEQALRRRKGRFPPLVTRRPVYSVDHPRKQAFRIRPCSVAGVACPFPGSDAFFILSDGSVHRWNLNTLDHAEVFSINKTVRAGAISNSGRWICAATGGAAVEVWDTETGEFLRSLSLPAEVVSLENWPGSESCLAALENGAVCQLSFEEKGIQPIISVGTIGSVTSLAVDPAGRILLCGCRNGEVLVWDLQAENVLLWRGRGHSSAVRCIAFGPDGQSVLTGGDDWAVRLWDAASGQETGTLLGHSSRISGLAASPDGQYVVSAGGWDQTLLVWDSASGRCASSLRSSSIEPTCLAVSPDARLLVSGGADGLLELWDVEKAVGT